MSPAIVLPPQTRSITDAHYRLYRRVIEIRDGLLALRPYREATAATGPMHRGAAGGRIDDDRRAAAVAAELRAALRAKASGTVVRGTVDARTDDGETADRWTGNDLASEAAWLARVARVYRRERD